MRANRVKAALAAGAIPVGHMVWEFKSRGISALVASAGCEFVIFDMEHSGLDFDRVADLLAWARGTDVTPIVRVPDLTYDYIARCLDSGALGVMIPNVGGEAEARRAVEMAKYPPMGRRGLGLGQANTGYEPVDTAAYLAEANAQTLIIAQVESPIGVEQADRMAALDGVDILWVGHYDLTASLGIPGQFDHPRYEEAVRTVIEACRRHGKAAGFQPGSPEQAQWALSRGFTCLSYGVDSSVYRQGLLGSVAEVRRLIAKGGGHG